MKKTSITILVVLGALLIILSLIGVSTWSWIGGFYDKANTTRVASQAKEKEAQQVYDKVWKVITQKAQVNQKYSEDFKKIFIGITEKKYSGKNPAMEWIKEQNPTLDVSLYRELSQAIEANRNEYLETVKEQLSIAQEHNTLVSSSESFFPCLVLRSFGNPNKACDTLEVKQVLSDRTEESFKSGKDNNVELFPKN